MPDDPHLPSGFSADEAAEYLRIWIHETAEQSDSLVETLLALERDPHDERRLAEAFRLVHSVKGSSALLGFDRVTALAHGLETHFERLRSRVAVFDAPTANVALRFIDYLRETNARLERGEPPPSNEALLAEVEALGDGTPPVDAPRLPAPPATRGIPTAGAGPAAPSAAAPPRGLRVGVTFRPGIPLVEAKAELVLARLASAGSVERSVPGAADLAAVAATHRLDAWISTQADLAAVRALADVDGAQSVDVVEEAAAPASAPSAGAESRPAGHETVRVDVGRLDVLLDLAGELVVNRSRFEQVARRLAPAFRGSAAAARSRAIAEDMRQALDALRDAGSPAGAAASPLAALEKQITALEEQVSLWEESGGHFDAMLEAVDQLSRVSDGLQRGVLGTRMVPVAPLFNRFKRSVRDIARELGKQVALEIRGETTELDKRMIDELGDPLVHLVRNAIDHGIEAAGERRRLGKPATATLRLEAFQRGSAVCVAISDDGAGIDTDRIRLRAVDRGLVDASVAASLSREELVDFIWQPGFSTAAAVSDISGRGVGMDIVRTRIARLNGSIEVSSTVGRGTTFTIRLPLTLAIVRCLLVGLPHAVFAVPMDNVRGIVAVDEKRIVTAGGRVHCEIRGEYLPLLDIHDVFRWADGERRLPPAGDVVILHAGGRSIGLRVGTLVGTQDVVVKSLDDNFRAIRGLGGASLLGDGSVCLLLDVAAVIDAAGRRRGSGDTAPPHTPVPTAGGPP